MAIQPYLLPHHGPSLDLFCHILSGMEWEECQRAQHSLGQNSKHHEHGFRSMNRVYLHQVCMSNIPCSRNQSYFRFHVDDYLYLFYHKLKVV